jgi:hypothetical protein
MKHILEFNKINFDDIDQIESTNFNQYEEVCDDIISRKAITTDNSHYFKVGKYNFPKLTNYYIFVPYGFDEKKLDEFLKNTKAVNYYKYLPSKNHRIGEFMTEGSGVFYSLKPKILNTDLGFMPHDNESMKWYNNRNFVFLGNINCYV